MARTKSTMSQSEIVDRHEDSRSPTPRSAAVPSHNSVTPVQEHNLATVPSTAPSVPAPPSSVKWVDNNGVKYPFPVDEADYDGDDVFNPIQFNAIGIVSTAFLNAGALSHTLKFTVTREDIQRIKTLIESNPDYRATEQFKWPFVDNVATANNKDNLAYAFEHVYDGRNKAVGDLSEEDLLPAHRIRPGVKVEVEYTPTCWAPRKSKDGIHSKFGAGGCSLKLMGVVLLEDKYHFESPRKKRKVT
jgi:hypothetical protein